MLVKPFADIPAHGNDSKVRTLLDVIDGEFNYFAGQSLTATLCVGERVGKRNGVPADLVVNGARDFAVYSQRVATRLGLVLEFLAHS